MYSSESNPSDALPITIIRAFYPDVKLVFIWVYIIVYLTSTQRKDSGYTLEWF